MRGDTQYTCSDDQCAAPLLTTRNIGQMTFLRRHPEVGGARVKDNAELLWRCADADWAVARPDGPGSSLLSHFDTAGHQIGSGLVCGIN